MIWLGLFNEIRGRRIKYPGHLGSGASFSDISLNNQKIVDSKHLGSADDTRLTHLSADRAPR